MLLPRRVSTARWLVGVAGLIGVTFLVALTLGRQAGGVALAAAAVFTVPLCSLGEWLVHGVLYHGRIPGLEVIRRIHHHGHHFALFPPDRYVQHGPFEFMRVRAPLTPFRMAESFLDDRLTKWGQVGLHLAAGVPLVLVPAWLLTRNPWFFAGTVLTLGVISWLLAHVHGAIHTPRDRWIERRWWFRWLDRHHYIHHIDLGANINFLLPLCDVLFGTQRPSLSQQERTAWPAFEQAKLGSRPVNAPVRQPSDDGASRR